MTKSYDIKITKLPGSIYKNNGRYWWKVKLRGQKKMKAYPLKPVGSRFATKNREVAGQVALRLYREHLRKNSNNEKNEAVKIGDLVSLYLTHARSYYKDASGKVSKEPDNIQYALVPLTDRYSMDLAEDFDSLKLKELRKDMIERNWCRNVINQRIGIVKRMFKWACSEQLIPQHVYQSLTTVEGLKRGRSGARDTKKVEPVPYGNMKAILPYLPPTVAAMVELQYLTGARSTEICTMRPCDIEVTGEVWLYKPKEHKTAYRGKDRIIPIGPKGQILLKPYLKTNIYEYCFTPVQAELERGNKRTQKLNDLYNKDSYRKAINYAIKTANKKFKETGEGFHVPHFTPHQLRHSAATNFRKISLEAARAVLGHSSVNMTTEYAEVDKKLAEQAARKIG